ncbi:MAG: hypothetical protein WCR98_06045 [Saccharofermentanales bacterium]
MTAWSLDYARDLDKATRSMVDHELQLTLAKPTYALLNMLLSDVQEITGDKIETPIALRDEGNAKHIDNPWAEDSHNIENITEMITSQFVMATNNVSYNEAEMDRNKGPERIFDLLKAKVQNAIREMADNIQPKLILSPTGSSDKANPTGLSSWFPLGTDGSTGAWNAYNGIYNDGSGTTFNVGGISCAAGVANNERWAAWYADHDGELGDNLLDLIDDASTDLSFISPIHPEVVGGPTKWTGFKFLTNKAVIRNLRGLLRKADDGLHSLETYHNVPLLNGIPMLYVPEADTARPSLYGTDPFWLVNMDLVKVYVVRGWKFRKKGPLVAPNQHNTYRTYWDLQYQIHCKDRRRGGGLISKQ